MTLQWMESQPDNEMVDLVFDEHSALESNIENFNSNKKDPFLVDYMRHAGTCSPGNDKEVAALQMADLLAGEFSVEGETGVRSDALRIIGSRNPVGYLRCEPPAQHMPAIELLNLGSQLRRDVGEYLKLDRQKLLNPEEALERLTNLFATEAFLKLQRKRLVGFLENDPEYQEFRRKYIAIVGVDPMTLTDGVGEEA